jgi:hypothetical protein
MAERDPSESLARLTFIATMAGAAVAIGVAVLWILL